MKGFSFFTAIALVATLFTGCDKDSETDGPVVPQLSIKTEAPVAIPAEGGECSIEYQILNASADGVVSADAGGAEWISAINCDTEGTVSFVAAANESGTERSAVVTVTYTYNGTETVDASISVVQSAPSTAYDFEMEVADFSGFYYGSDNGVNGELNYYINLSDVGYTEEGYSKPNGKYYQLDVFTDQEPVDMEAITLPEGTYTLGEPGKTDVGTFTPDYSNFYVTDENALTSQKIKFTEGTIVVVKEGSLFKYDIKLVDENGDTHHLTYEGDAIIDSGLAEMTSPTTLTEDYEVPFAAESECLAMNFGDVTGLGNSSWLIDIYPSSKTGEEVMFQCFSDISDRVPVGRYTASVEMTSGTFHPGLTDGFNLYSSWYLLAENGALGEQFAALIDGSFEIVDNGDGTHTITFDTYDAAGNNITGSWTGEIYIDTSSVMSTMAVRTAKVLPVRNMRAHNMR